MVFKEVWLKNIYEKNKIVVEEGDLVIDIGTQGFLALMLQN